MSRRNNDALDDPWVEQGDRFFVGYNEKLHRCNLPEGFVAKSINKRFTNGHAMRRKGVTMPRGNFHWTNPLDKFIGSAVYSNPNGQERLILAPTRVVGPGGGTVGINAYAVDTDNYITIQLPAGVVIQPSMPVWFCQAFDKLVMLVSGLYKYYGTNQQYLTNGFIWDGNEANPQFQWFTPPVDPELQIIPPSSFAWPVSNRVVYATNYLNPHAVPHFTKNGFVYDHLFISDIEAPMQVDPFNGDFRINTGEGDHIHSIIPYAYDTLVIFMHKSIHLLSNFSIDFTLATQELLTSYQGSGSIRSPIQVGQEVYYMVERLGVFRLSETLERRLMSHVLPVSDPIQPVIDRINWKYQNLIVSAAADNYLFFAVPLDGAQVNNAILVFNSTTSNWETIDKFDIPLFSIDNILPVHIGDVRRIVAIQNGPPPVVYLLYEGDQDQTVFDPVTPRFTDIYDMIETRGYGLTEQGGPTGFNRFERGSVILDTINPNVKITAVSEGVNEEKVLRESVTKNPVKFYIHGHPDYQPNLQQQIFEPKREDYTVPGTNQLVAGQDFSQMPEGPILSKTIPPLVPVPGIQPLVIPPQMSRERFPVRVIDRTLSLRVENFKGDCTIRATSVEFRETKRGGREAA